MVQKGSTEGGLPADEGRKAIPVAAMVESIIGCKWSARLRGFLASGPTRPSGLLRACTGLSAKVMNERLRKMLLFGIAQRTVLGETPPVKVEYLLTPFGRRFMRIIEEVRRLQEVVNHGSISEPVDVQDEARRSG